jgi:hypothetical protein
MYNARTWTPVEEAQYKGIEVDVSPDDKAAFAEAVMFTAAGTFDADISKEMADRKLEALKAQEIMRINQDAIYHILADMTAILKSAYRTTGVARPAAQVRSEAMDIMLQTIAADYREPSGELFFELLKGLITQYRTLPEQFDAKLEEIVRERKQQTDEMTAEERAIEAFTAYIGSLDITEERWRAQNFKKATLMAKYDLLLDTVSDKERIKAMPEEIEQKYYQIADDCGLDISIVKAGIDARTLAWQIRREKADKLIAGSAIQRNSRPAGF